MTAFVPLCHLNDLPDGEARGFDPLGGGQDTVLLVRQGGQVHAWRDACPHHGTPMAWRRHAYLNAAQDRIVCAAHNGVAHLTDQTFGQAIEDALEQVSDTLQNHRNAFS